ncbi:unnamed protein product [Urochloa decumbens]|uniref:Uncharacterized protein n=1 Tax=Urochloa decumbens TaxID=240449 RepID=A0ABC9F510_9POAL
MISIQRSDNGASKKEKKVIYPSKQLSGAAASRASSQSQQSKRHLSKKRRKRPSFPRGRGDQVAAARRSRSSGRRSGRRDADPGPGDLDHPGDAGARAVPAAGGAGGQAAGAGAVHHAAAVAAAGVLVGVGTPRRPGPAHHEHHDVRPRSAAGALLQLQWSGGALPG